MKTSPNQGAAAPTRFTIYICKLSNYQHCVPSALARRSLSFGVRQVMRKRIAIAIALLAGVAIAWSLRPYDCSYDSTKVAPGLRALADCRSLRVAQCMCGDFAVHFVDSTGKTNRFAIPTQDTPFTFVLLGTDDPHTTNGTELTLLSDTRNMLISVVERRVAGSTRDDLLLGLRASGRDRAIYFWHVTCITASRFSHLFKSWFA